MPKNSKTKNPQQKGERRQRLHENQDNVGDKKNKDEYSSMS